MCLAVNQADKQELLRRIQAWANGELLLDGWEPSEKMAAHALPRLPVLLADGGVALAAWGLIPDTMTFNARIETIFEKPSFRQAAPRQRCLIPVNAFWEYQHLDKAGHPDPEGKATKPFLIRLADDKVMLLGGLWSRWKGALTMTVVTKPANPLMSRIHNAKQRMPVIVSPAEAERWLAGGGTRELEAFALPRDDGLVAQEVERPQRPPKNSGPAQGSLF